MRLIGHSFFNMGGQRRTVNMIGCSFVFNFDFKKEEDQKGLEKEQETTKDTLKNSAILSEKFCLFRKICENFSLNCLLPFCFKF